MRWPPLTIMPPQARLLPTDSDGLETGDITLLHLQGPDQISLL